VIEIAGDRGRMTGRGTVAATLSEAGAGKAGDRAVEIGGRDLVYMPNDRTLTMTSEAFVRLPDAGLEAGRISAVIGRDGRTVDSLEAAKDVVVSKDRYRGRSAAALYDSAARRLSLTGRPVLTDGKGGSARGDKLTFDLADDKILIENEGSGRATTVVRS
jgi:lipopolysaccharide export system protein LptA